MKKLFIRTLAVLASIGFVRAIAAPVPAADPPAEIDAVIRQYFTAMRSRNVEELRAVLAAKFIAIEAGRTNAKTHIVDSKNPGELLPPAGNKDWESIRLSSIVPAVSATHPSVATASFTLTMPLDARRVEGLQAALKAKPSRFDEAQRLVISQMIADRAIKNDMLALLALQDGRWKIVSLTFPD